MKIIGVIPARYQSSRFPGKPLVDICGHPMIWWVYQQCLKVNGLDEVIVATDDERILDACNKFDIRAIITSEKHRTGTDRVGEVASLIPADFYLNIQGDEPLIEPESISKIIFYKKEHPTVEIINSMTKMQEADVQVNTIVKVVSSQNDDLLYLSRAPVPYPKNGQSIQYYKHLGLYGMTRTALEFFASSERTKNEIIEDIEMLRFIENGRTIKIIDVQSNSIGVDKPEDILKVENVIKISNRSELQ